MIAISYPLCFAEPNSAAAMDDSTNASLQNQRDTELQSLPSHRDVDAPPLESRTSFRRSRNTFWSLGVLLAAVATIFFVRVLSDPLRGLEAFPVEEYHHRYKMLQGNLFKAELTVIEQLDWKNGYGRHVIFLTHPAERPIAVHIPADIDTLQYPPGRRFRARISVLDKGLVQASYLSPY